MCVTPPEPCQGVRRERKRGAQPKTVGEVDSVHLVPCDPGAASVCCLHADVVSLSVSALCGAGRLGFSAEQLCDWFADGSEACQPGLYRVRRLLTSLMQNGVPLLLATGCKREEQVQTSLRGANAKFEAGSLVLICDDRDNLLALTRPMGSLVYVPPGEDGFVPADLKGDNDRLHAVEMWLEVLCVATPQFDKAAWFKNGDGDYNWDIDGKGAALANQGAQVYLPRSGLLTDLFPCITLATLDHQLGDYKSKLAGLTGVTLERKKYGVGRPSSEVLQARREEELNDPTRYKLWRRAVLLEKLLAASDPGGRARRSLQHLLPHGMVGDVDPGAAAHAAIAGFDVDGLTAGLDAAVVHEMARQAAGEQQQKPGRAGRKRRS